jgi:multidrug efflux pump subunit AcrA (membrane-fusion protein)
MTRTVPIRVIVTEPTNVTFNNIAESSGRGPTRPAAVVPPTIFSGMYVKVRIPIRPVMPLVEIPRKALQPGEKVWVVQDGRLRIREATVVRSMGSSVLVRQGTEGLNPNDRVVVSPLARVQDGMAVNEVVAK